MWWWWLLLTAAAVVDGGWFSTPDSEELPAATVDGTMSEKDLKYLKDQYDKLTEQYLGSFAEAQTPRHTRRKRELTVHPNASLLADYTGVFRLRSVKPLLSVCSPTVEMKFIDVNNWTYTLCVTSATAFAPASVFIGYITANEWVPLTSWYINNPEAAAVFYDNGILYALVADSRNGEGIPLVKFDLRYQSTSVDHTVHAAYPTAVAIWRMKADGRVHMAVANSAGDETEAFGTEIYTYHWMGTYFDRYSSMAALDVKDIEPFHIHGAAYLAVANFRAGKDNFMVDSEILKYNLDLERWISHQKIRTYGAMDWEFFSLGEGTGEEFFLVVANNHARDGTTGSPFSSVIYKFVKDLFVPFQCLAIPSATSVSAFSDDTKFLLAIGSQDDGVFLFQYGGWRFVEASVQYTQSTMSSGVTALTFHNIVQLNDSIILGVSNTLPRFMSEASIFEISFIYENPLQEWYDRSTEWCMSTFESLQEPSATAPLQEIKNLFFVDQKDPIVIEGNLYFDGGLEASELKTPKLVETTTGKVYDDSVLKKLSELKSRLEDAKQRIIRISEVLSKALTLEGSQEVTANLEFRDVQFSCQVSTCHFENITTTFLNGEDVSGWRENIVLLDEDQVIGTSLSVENIEAEDIIVGGLVDGVNMSNVVTKHGNHTITGHKTFTNLLQVNDVVVAGLVDGIKLSPETVLLKTGHQTVTGTLTFQDVEAEWVEVTGLLNGRDFNEFARDVVQTEGSFIITGKKTFNNITVEDLRMASGSTMNGVDLLDLWNHAMWKDKDQTITAPMTFASMVIKKNLYVEGPINGLMIPSSEILFLDENATITAPQTFMDAISINQLYVRNSINGISVDPDTGELDILMKTGEQVITGHKTFQTIFLDDHSFVGGKIDGVDLVELQAAVLHKNTLNESAGSWVFNNLVVKGPLTVKGKISGVDIEDVYNRALKLNDTELPNFNSFVFEEMVTIDELNTDNINGIDVAKDLVLANEAQTITGVKTFHDIVFEDDVIVEERVNNIDLGFLSDTLLRLGDQVIISNKTMSGNIKVNRLTLNGSINGVNFGEIVTLDNHHAITGTKTLKNVTFQNIVVKNMEIGGLVNGVDILKMMEDTLTYDGEQTVTGTKTIRGALVIPSGSNLQTSNLNGVDLSALFADAVLKDEDQVIGGRKHFAASVAFENLVVKGSIDGVTEWDMKNWLLQGEDQVITANTTFLSPVTASDVTVNGLVNGINITRLAETIVKTNEPAVINGAVVFEDVISMGDITLTGKIQGLDLSEEVVDKSKDNIITAGKTFAGDLAVGDLTIGSLLDGVSVDDICRKTILLNKPQKLSSLTVVGDVIFEQGGTVNGTVSGVDINRLYDEAVKSVDEDTLVNGLKTFDNLTIEGTLTVLGKFGGVDIEDLNRNYMSRTRDQVIKAPMKFEHLQLNGTLAARSFFTLDGKINDIDIAELNRTVLRTTGQQVVNATYTFTDVIFEDDVFVAGKVNGLEIPKGLMLRNKENVIHSPKIFMQPVLVLGDLNVGEGNTIQGVDVSEWYKNAVKKDYGTYEIKGQKNFTSFTAEDLVVDGLVDGVKFSEDSLLLTYGDQVITGPKTIHGDVEIYGSLTVTGLINGTDLEDLADRAVRKDRNNTITGHKTFTKPLRINDLEVPSINGVDIDELNKKVNAELDLEPLRSKMDLLDDVIAEMQHALDNQAVIFQYYELFQTFDVPGGYGWCHVPTDNGEYLLLSDSFVLYNGCTNVRVYEYSPSVNAFVPSNEDLVSSSAVAVRSIKAWNRTLVFVANSQPNMNCSNTPKSWDSVDPDIVPSNIYIYDRGNRAFLAYQTLETRPVVDAVAFSDGSTACIVYLQVQDVVVYCSLETLQQFTFREKLRTIKGRKASLCQIRGETFLAVASVDIPNLGYEQSVDIYKWNRAMKAFGDPHQVIRSTHATSVLLMPVNYDRFHDVFLAISEGVIPRINNVPRLFIYRYEGGVFHKYQEIKDHGDLDYVALSTGEVMFFALDTRKGEIKLYQNKGVSGFVNVDTIPSVGTLTLHAFKRNSSEDHMNHYLALAGLQKTLPNVWDDVQLPKIIKSKFKGKSVPKPVN